MYLCHIEISRDHNGLEQLIVSLVGVHKSISSLTLGAKLTAGYQIWDFADQFC